jgi:uncharacterized protein (TIGR02246 family)
MADDDAQAIRELVERWVQAIRDGDLGGVLADHTDDVVMFDVPPPYEGARGAEAYAATWPPFLEWVRGGAVFALDTLEVTAGGDVAFAHALLRCGRPEELAAHPELRLRLTLGLRREDGQWRIAHEHHSFPAEDAPVEVTAEEVREVHRGWAADTEAGDLDALVRPIADDVVSYEHGGPLQYVGLDAVREVCRAGLESSEGPVTWEIPDLRVEVAGDLAVTWGLDRITPRDAAGTPRPTWSRGTRVFRRRDGRWRMVHQHLSFPLDPDTGEARTDLEP